jgi:hypothetical protein
MGEEITIGYINIYHAFADRRRLLPFDECKCEACQWKISDKKRWRKRERMLRPIADGLQELRSYRRRHNKHLSWLTDEGELARVIGDPDTKRMLAVAQGLVKSICETLDVVTSDLSPWFEVPYFIRRALHQSEGDRDALTMSKQDRQNEWMLLSICLGVEHPRAREIHGEVAANEIARMLGAA